MIPSDPEMRVLAEMQPWANLMLLRDPGILSMSIGYKSAEVRNTNTTAGKVAIYATQSRYTHRQIQELMDWFTVLYDDGAISDWLHNFACSSIIGGQKGKILGTVEIYKTLKIESLEQFESYRFQTHAPDKFYNEKTWLWFLKNPIIFKEPVSYKPPRGSVIWSKTELPEVIA